MKIYTFYHCLSLLLFTFLNCSRPHTALPKNLISIGCWTLNMIRGRIRCTLFGNEYQFKMLAIFSNWKNAILNRWPASLAKKTMLVAPRPLPIDSSSTTEFMASHDWKCESKINFKIVFISIGILNMGILNYFHVNLEQRNRYYDTACSEQNRNWNFEQLWKTTDQSKKR